MNRPIIEIKRIKRNIVPNINISPHCNVFINNLYYDVQLQENIVRLSLV